MTCICTNPRSVYHLLLECPTYQYHGSIIKEKDGYDFTGPEHDAYVYVIYNTDVVSYVAKLFVHSPVGKLM